MSRRIPGLDGIRALAVLLVFVQHKPGGRGFSYGALGVDIFFVLSGFLIVGILHGLRGRIEAGVVGPGDALRDFWMKRVRRIFPVYYVAVGAVVAWAVLHGRNLVQEGLVPWYLLMAPNVYIGWFSKQWTWYSHLWSIGVEQHFYLLIAPLLLWLPSRRHRAALLALLAASLLSTALHLVADADARSLYVSSWSNFALMAAGGLLAIAPARSATARSPIGLGIAAVVLLIACTETPLRAAFSHTGYRAAYTLLGLVIGASLIAHVVARPGGPLVRLLEWPPLRGLGVVSYGFYAYHALLPRPPLPAFLRESALAVAVVDFAFCVLVATASWWWMERRLLRPRDDVSRRGSDPAPVTTPVFTMADPDRTALPSSTKQ